MAKSFSSCSPSNGEKTTDSLDSLLARLSPGSKKSLKSFPNLSISKWKMIAPHTWIGIVLCQEVTRKSATLLTSLPTVKIRIGCGTDWNGRHVKRNQTLGSKLLFWKGWASSFFECPCHCVSFPWVNGTEIRREVEGWNHHCLACSLIPVFFWEVLFRIRLE